jgi:hypothetical protein
MMSRAEQKNGRFMTMRFILLAGIVALALLGLSHVSANGDQTTSCVDRPISFDPLFKPSGCFSYKPIDGGIVVIGRALLEFKFLEYGRAVEARVNGNMCGSVTIPGADGVFVLPVAGGDSQPGCATAGQRVDFYIYGALAGQTLVWPPTLGPNPSFLSLSSVSNVAWYWFERAAATPPHVGTTVEAYVNGTPCGETTIGGEAQALGAFNRPNIRGFLRLIVPPTNSDCAQDNALTEFRVNGLRAETALLWRPGVQRLNLLVQGDANCDFLVDSRDALLALQAEAGLIASVPCHGDADRDGDIDVFDARHILEFAAGVTSALPL